MWWWRLQRGGSSQSQALMFGAMSASRGLGLKEATDRENKSAQDAVNAEMLAMAKALHMKRDHPEINILNNLYTLRI